MVRKILLQLAIGAMATAAALVWLERPARGDGPPSTVYQTRYYVIHTDLDAPVEREVALHMTKMAEEYARRTRQFSGAIRARMDFYVYAGAAEYHADGGPAGSIGFFNGQRLMAVTGNEPGPRAWHVIQHEGFHQFALACIGPNLPIWVNEGLAEYFGEAAFTGDGFVTDLIPPARLARLQEALAGKDDSATLLPLAKFMELDDREWMGDLTVAHYDQAWSMVYFLVNGDEGKYRQAFNAFMVDLSHGKNGKQAWQERFGAGTGFEEKWRKYWESMPRNPTDDLYARATVATLTSFLARAAEARQRFAGFDDFGRAVAEGKLAMKEEDWLPANLATRAMVDALEREKNGDRFSIVAGADHDEQLVCQTAQGKKWVGKYKMSGEKVAEVEVVEAAN